MQLIFTALKFMKFDKPKSIGALFGVIISIFLIGQQTGIFIFLTNAMCYLVRVNDTYVWVTDNKTTNVNALAPIDVRLGYEIESLPHVVKSHELVIASGAARFTDGTSAGLSVVGVETPDFAGLPAEAIVEGKIQDLVSDGALTVDFFDGKALGNPSKGDYFEINGKQVFIAAKTRGSRGFGGGLFSYTTAERARFLGKVPLTKASAFLITVDKPKNMSAVVAAINANIPGVKAWMPNAFKNETILTVLKSSGIAFSFGTLIIFALISGFVIIGLTLYSAAIDRIKDYGTLKAIGATNGFIRKLILMQAIIYALIGFVIGYALIEGFRNGIANAGTLFTFPFAAKVAFFVITALISISGTLFAIRRIAKLEPASVFRST
jgi:putative ABC transport system permease protein